MTTQASRSSHALATGQLTAAQRRQLAAGARPESAVTDQRPVLLVVEAGAAIETLLTPTTNAFQLVMADNRDTSINQMRRHDPVVVAIDLDRGDLLAPTLGNLTLEAAGMAIESPSAAGQAEAFRTLQDLMALSPTTRFIAITAPGDREASIRAIAMGVHDVFEKPLQGEAFSLIVDRAFRLADLEQENNRRLDAMTPSGIEGVVTRAPGMLRLCRQVSDLSQTHETVLLMGESGSGKHLLAQALHLMSPRNEQRFAVIRCTATDSGRIETELFGVERLEGAPDDNGHPRVRTYPGKLELANGGTLFLDEISELTPGLQLRLLHFLEGRTISRLGSSDELRLDVRIVCATRRDLNELAALGQFHPGLAYLLCEMTLKVPPLRDRSGDAALLAHAMLRRLGRRHGRNRLSFSEAALDAIGNHPFPGNVQELENAVRHAIVNVTGRVINPADLGLPTPETPDTLNLRRIRDEAERQAVLRVMARSDGNVARAAELLGISRPTLYDLLNRFGLR